MVIIMDFCSFSSGRSHQGRVPPGVKFFLFMQFSAKELQNNRLAHPFGFDAPGKSWIHHSLGFFRHNLHSYIYDSTLDIG